MTAESSEESQELVTGQAITRRDLMRGALSTVLVASRVPLLAKSSVAQSAGRRGAVRSVNIMNFIRATEPRGPMDLIKPVREQMALIKKYGFSATWLLQYDALVEGPFVEFLKAEMPPDHEVGLWFEMNRHHVQDAGLEWRGRPDWEWDYHVPVAYSIGYTQEERRKLVDTAVATFKRTFGKDVKSVASWNLDAVSIAHFSDQHRVDAFGNCRDQLATDGFTIWGCPIAGYYPCRLNAWSPAQELKNQISTPMLRLLGQDPVYYYDNTIPYPDTMEPAWPSGQNTVFVDRFLDMIANKPTQAFGYAQLGQENSFGWPTMGKGFAMQMEKLAGKNSNGRGDLVIETMGETGRRFKRQFKMTPPQAQVMLEDPFGRTEVPERSVWYQSKSLRANLHFRGSEFYLRDLHVYNDEFPQPFLVDTVKQHGIEQRLLAVLDGYHWSENGADKQHPERRAKGRFVLVGEDGRQTRLSMKGLPVVTETASSLQAQIPLVEGGSLLVSFRERDIAFQLSGEPTSKSRLGLVFEWDPAKSAFKEVSADSLKYRFRDFDYALQIGNGVATKTDKGVNIVSQKRGALKLVVGRQS